LVETFVDNLMRIGELAERTGKTARALHFYEELGLVVPFERSPGGFRKYDEMALLRVQWIDRLQQLDFSLAQIRDFFEEFRAQQTGPMAMEHLREFYAAKVVETRETITRLQALENELTESLSYLDICANCDHGTPRSACNPCAQHTKIGMDAPTMVAALSNIHSAE